VAYERVKRTYCVVFDSINQFMDIVQRYGMAPIKSLRPVLRRMINSCLTFWRRNVLLNFSIPVYKM
jgi:hypothetical protein